MWQKSVYVLFGMVVAPAIKPILKGVARPVTREAIKLSLLASDKVHAIAQDVREDIEDLTAEARASIQHETPHARKRARPRKSKPSPREDSAGGVCGAASPEVCLSIARGVTIDRKRGRRDQRRRNPAALRPARAQPDSVVAGLFFRACDQWSLLGRWTGRPRARRRRIRRRLSLRGGTAYSFLALLVLRACGVSCWMDARASGGQVFDVLAHVLGDGVEPVAGQEADLDRFTRHGPRHALEDRLDRRTGQPYQT